MQIILYRLRKENGLSQSDLAEVIGKSETSYRNKELGKQDFRSTEMFKIANYFHKNIGDIFIDTTSRNEKL
ncbi:helix-turn-helix transcriptional regulator [Streptococcus uberis]|uniref:helix-turn-helix transcriptional regulator n=1 Tax=Streptococcus uberis TaxID=1349 RepID=UPI001FF38BCE|nr:helix-turn-helix transcriptional regulator [Streptococcus uberis]MCK1228262.1 helix-turn-helix transcriptional regulator [Streptococcus uberis]